MSIFVEAAEAHLQVLTGSQLAQLGYGLGQLGVQPPAQWMDNFLAQVQNHEHAVLCLLSAHPGLITAANALGETIDGSNCSKCHSSLAGMRSAVILTAADVTLIGWLVVCA
jgi:hypothetical protein